LSQEKDLRFALFTAFCPGGPLGLPWHYPGSVDFDYLSLDDQTDLARKLEAARFDALFWADFSGVHDTYQGSADVAIRDAVQFPIADPLVLAAALAGRTEHIGLACSANMAQQNPYNFARRIGTLDHLSKGRAAWNIVTSFQPSAWINAGFDKMASHADRYQRAAEYVEVVEKLLTESWEDDAVVRDVERRVYADPSKVHPIAYEGQFYRVPGIGLIEPSPQRMPVKFQAGTSNDGRNFAAANAEAMFIGANSPQGATLLIDDMTQRLIKVGRNRDDMLFLQFMPIMVASTEAEAAQITAGLDEEATSDASIAFYSSSLGFDLSKIDIDRPINDLDTESSQGSMRSLLESIPDKTWTIRDMVGNTQRNRMIGTPEYIADELEKWRDAGVDGINYAPLSGLRGLDDFVEQAVPVLQKRGLMQREYRSGTLREKLFRQ
jgi:FMN-dependent oxidoreductase (nitrilotriacetate monooxygenase family)